MNDHADDRAGLIAIIRDIRRRWRMKLVLRGAAVTAGCAAAALVLSAWGLQWMRFTPQSILLFRILLSATVLVVGCLFIGRPLTRRVTDEQVALYLEEHEPTLEAAIISAVETGNGEGGMGNGARSPALLRKLVETAVEKCRAVEEGRRVERQPMRKYSGALGAVVVIATAIFLLGPAYMRHALSALLVISRSVEAAAPYRIDVTPGHKTIPRGADQVVTARLIGFEADQASLMVRKSATAAFERLPLVRNAAGQYEATLFDVAAPIDYFVESVGVRSNVYSLKVADMPYVQRLELEYHFPAYTGLAPRRIEDGGDIAVLRGTEIRLRAVPTLHADAGGVVIDDKSQVPLAVAPDGALTGHFVADHDGFYRIELAAGNGPRVGASPKYSIDVLDDRPPTISFTKPGRDTSASPIEEVFLEAKAEDDYGIRSIDLVYSVNGGPEKTVKLFDGNTRMTSVVAGHTLYLEEMNVKPGDSVSYYARAFDNDSVTGPQKATSDIYFLRVRPLQKDFRKAESQAGGGGQGQQNQVGALSQQERQIISATFNLQRDRRTMKGDKAKEAAVVIGLMQKRLRDQVTELLGNFATRVGNQAEQFKKITDFLKQSVPEMQTAETKLQASSTDQALPPENRALEFLQKAEEEYQLQVAANSQGGAGQGGGGQQMAEELADLFELEVDKMANQYETSQRASAQQADQKIDELAEKLKELARRQEQEAERQRRRAQAGQGSGGGDAQRSLAEQAEEAARQLEKLARDENRPQLQQTARQLQQAADAMRQAAANGDPNAAAQAARAMEQLKEAERQLQQAQAGRTGRDVADALRQAEAMAREQQQIQSEVSKLDSQGNGSARSDKVQQLSQRKNALAGQVDQLEKQLDRSAASMFKEERDASRKLSEAANAIRDRRIRDRIRYSDQMLRAGSQTSDVAAFERDIQNNLDDLTKKIGDAAAAVGHSRPDASAQALDKARQLSDGMQSLGERMRQQSGANSQNPTPNSQSARAGQSGREGQQGNSQNPTPNSQSGSRGQAGGQGQQGNSQNPTPNSQSGPRGQSGGQGQQGQQGQGQGQGEQQGANTAPGAGSMSNSRPGVGRFSPEDVRQFRGEARQRTNDAEQLRRLLQQGKIDSKELDQIIKGLKQLEDERTYQNPEALAKLESAVTDNIKRFEYTLRRRLDGNANQVFLSGTDDVPEQYRKLVEQYYRALSKGGKQ